MEVGWDDDVCFCLVVSDEGLGIFDEDCVYFFDMFYSWC